MLKLYFLVLTMVFFESDILAQDFEGKITYMNLMGAPSFINVVTEVYIKGNKAKTFKSVNNVRMDSYVLNLQNQFYVVHENTELISKESKSESAKMENNIIIDGLRQLNRKENILGYSCTLYRKDRTNNFGKDIIIYSIADSLGADITNGYMIDGLGIVLKIVQKTAEKITITEAVEIDKMTLEDDFFTLPEYPIKEVNFKTLSNKYLNKNH